MERNTQIITKVMTPWAWFELQKSDRMIDLLDYEVVRRIGDIKEVRCTFIWSMDEGR
jgi:hypothetical protein